jgi:thiol-disulfide isomerase/thioredoxin
MARWRDHSLHDGDEVSRLAPGSARLHRLALPVAAAIAGGCGEGGEFRPLREGDVAPAYAAVTLDGDSFVSMPRHGRPLLLNVWATWCIPCRHEMPGLQQLHERLGDRLRVVGVSVDRGPVDAVHAFVGDYDLSFEIVHDPAERVVRAFRTSGVPETFLIAADGRIRRRWIGAFDPLGKSALSVIDRTVSEGAPSSSTTPVLHVLRRAPGSTR